MTVSKEDLKLVEDKIDNHLANSSQWRREQEEVQAHNSTAIKDLTEATQPLVDALTAVTLFHRFIKFMSGFAFVVVIIAKGEAIKTWAYNLFS